MGFTNGISSLDVKYVCTLYPLALVHYALGGVTVSHTLICQGLQRHKYVRAKRAAG